ncbi:MAG: GGDEF and EAL domain-containing protein [Candidatus Gastranaerophilales bacterium]|nr:GGDEF and EAL domain-containing protein [Candidatus Gastranaerophilales bacterium]
MKRDEMAAVDRFWDIFNILDPSMDDYLFVYDMQNDYYCISPSAVERFAVPQSRFHNIVENCEKFVYPADLKPLQEDLRLIQNNQKSTHDIEYRWLDKEGKPVWINCRGQVIRDAQGEPEFLIGCINEIGMKQRADNISNAMRETSLQRELEKQGQNRLEGYILRIGIDNFKEINENRGIDYGDMILRKTAECIEEMLDPGQKFYRVVADEFIVLDLMERHGEEDAVRLYKRIRSGIDYFIAENHYEVFYTISAGVLALDKVKNQEYINLMKLSEFALNEAKNHGKNQHYLYDLGDYKLFLHRRKLLRTLRWAVNNHCEGFEAYFQPIVDIGQKKLIGAETLLRFQHEELGAISPVEFIPLLEESGLIIPVGKWVLEQALEACSRIQQKIPDFRVSVNISYIQVLKSSVLNVILDLVKRYQLKPGSLMIELTESGFLESNENFIKFCSGLRENGILLALDDFGTGYSNFHYLYNLNPDTIKIDRSFTLMALKNPYEYNLLRHMVDMTHSIDLKLCIEGIETDQELQKICEMNPDYIQGYYFGKPSPYDSFVADHIQGKGEA